MKKDRKKCVTYACEKGNECFSCQFSLLLANLAKRPKNRKFVWQYINTCVKRVFFRLFSSHVEKGVPYIQENTNKHVEQERKVRGENSGVSTLTEMSETSEIAVLSVFRLKVRLCADYNCVHILFIYFAYRKNLRKLDPGRKFERIVFPIATAV